MIGVAGTSSLAYADTVKPPAAPAPSVEIPVATIDPTPGAPVAPPPTSSPPARPTPTEAKRLHVDWTRCDGRGLCAELLPAILDRDDCGYPVAHDGSREPPVPSGDLSEALAAVHHCPRLALTLTASSMS